MVNYYFRIKITLKLAQTHQFKRKLTRYVVRIKRGQYMKKSGKLLFWNKNNIKTCSNTSINSELTPYVVIIKRGQ